MLNNENIDYSEISISFILKTIASNQQLLSSFKFAYRHPSCSMSLQNHLKICIQKTFDNPYFSLPVMDYDRLISELINLIVANGDSNERN